MTKDEALAPREVWVAANEIIYKAVVLGETCWGEIKLSRGSQDSYFSVSPGNLFHTREEAAREVMNRIDARLVASENRMNKSIDSHNKLTLRMVNARKRLEKCLL